MQYIAFKHYMASITMAWLSTYTPLASIRCSCTPRLCSPWPGSLSPSSAPLLLEPLISSSHSVSHWQRYSNDEWLCYRFTAMMIDCVIAPLRWWMIVSAFHCNDERLCLRTYLILSCYWSLCFSCHVDHRYLWSQDPVVMRDLYHVSDDWWWITPSLTIYNSLLNACIYVYVYWYLVDYLLFTIECIHIYVYMYYYH